MSGVIMFREANGITVLSDGGYFTSVEDFTIKGWSSKPKTYPHINAVIVSLGTVTTSTMLDYLRSYEWESFDDLLDSVEKDAEYAVGAIWELEPQRELHTVLYIGGFSESRQRWETYTLTIDGKDREFPVGDLAPAAQVELFPMPDHDSLVAMGFNPDNPAIAHEDDRVRLMQAMRLTPQFMGKEGENADTAPKGHTVGGFIERVDLTHGMALRRIVWRWPDRVGELIDPEEMGEAVG